MAGRAKLRMELISNEKTRRKTFEMRKKGLEKKATELSILCGVKIGMILYGPLQENQANEPMIWPDNYDEISFMIDSYKSSFGRDCRYRTYGLSAFFKDQTEKINEELANIEKKVREVKYPVWDERYNGLSKEQLNNFYGVLSTKIDAVGERIKLLKGTQQFSFTQTGALMNPSVEENSSFMPSTSMNPSVEENDMPSMSNMRYEQPHMSQWPLPPSVEEDTVFIPSMSNMSDEQPNMFQWPRPLTYYDTQTIMPNQTMPMNNGYQIQDPFTCHDNMISNYVKFPVQNFGTPESFCTGNAEAPMNGNGLLGDMISNVGKPLIYDDNTLTGNTIAPGVANDELYRYQNLC